MAATPTFHAAPPVGGESRGHGFGTVPVFLASVGTILGAIMFLLFGDAVGHAGLGSGLLRRPEEFNELLWVWARQEIVIE